MDKGAKSGFIVMILAVLGVVLFVTMFSTVMDEFDTLYNHVSIGTFTAMQTVVGIAPTILFLGGIFGAGYGYYRGYKSVGGKGGDPGGLLRMVLGVLMIILFITLFSTILTNMATLYTATNASSFTAFTTVVSIAPTVLFLSGIFAGGATAVGGIKARRKRRRAFR